MRFVIVAGKEFDCEFVIKKPDSSTPLNLTGTSGVFTMTEIGPNNCIILNSIPLNVKDAENGVMSLSLSSTQTSDLLGEKMFAEDGYPLIPTYSGYLDISHPVEGKIYVDIPKIYVKDSTCPVTQA